MGIRKEKGFTLIEVLAALLIMGLVVGTAAQTLTWQAKIAAQGNREIETHHASRTAMSFMEREVRQARVVTLHKPGVLKIIRHNNQMVYFYVADKDGNGIKDLYLETDGVPNPVVSFVEEVSFVEKSRGEWEISVTARQDGVENSWTVTVKQRAN